MSLRLSKEHGVNPSVQLCFWCQESMGVLLLGANRGKKAPREMIIDYEPCDTCKAKFEQGILLMEASKEPNHDDQPILGNAYPTGRWCVISEEGAQNTFEEGAAAAALESRKVFLDKEVWEALGLHEEQKEEAND